MAIAHPGFSRESALLKQDSVHSQWSIKYQGRDIRASNSDWRLGAPSGNLGAVRLLSVMTTLVFGWFTSSGQAPMQLLTNAAQIRQLTAAQAARSIPVRLQGVVVTEAGPANRAAGDLG